LTWQAEACQVEAVDVAAVPPDRGLECAPAEGAGPRRRDGHHRHAKTDKGKIPGEAWPKGDHSAERG
jgi:hypothetical protein